jgi:oxygen-independent coproporphyrinogen-3 oxidase
MASGLRTELDVSRAPIALYVHIPFCAVRCHYCDFNTFAGLERYFEPFTAALVSEIRRAGAVLGRPPVRTIFVGGGTPTVLPPERLAQALGACRDAFDVAQDAEITSEANPGTVDQERFAALIGMGINRLSMGVQSFDDAELRWLGRIHSADEATAAFAAARRAGFANINLDLMFGLPGQAPETWQRSLWRALALGPEHLSLYSLTVEPGTPLANSVRLGLASPPDDDLAADLYLAAQDILAAHRYVQYEISNWARDGAQPAGPVANPQYACRHNLVYWRAEPYLGFGPGAHSYYGARRFWNVRPVPEYIQRLARDASVESGSEAIDTRMAQGEIMMLGLRLVREGVAASRFRERFGMTPGEVFGAEILDLQRRDLLEEVRGAESTHLRLTAQGKLLGNRVFAEFLPTE